MYGIFVVNVCFLNMLLTPADGGKRIEQSQYATVEISHRIKEISETKEVISTQEITYKTDSLSYHPTESSLKVVQIKPEMPSEVPSKSELQRKPQIEVELAPSEGMLAWSWD